MDFANVHLLIFVINSKYLINYKHKIKCKLRIYSINLNSDSSLLSRVLWRLVICSLNIKLIYRSIAQSELCIAQSESHYNILIC